MKFKKEWKAWYIICLILSSFYFHHLPYERIELGFPAYYLVLRLNEPIIYIISMNIFGLIFNLVVIHIFLNVMHKLWLKIKIYANLLLMLK